MKIKANTKTVEIIDETKITSGSYNDVTLDVELSREYEGLTTFVTFDDIKMMVIGNMVNVPTLKAGNCRIGVFAVKIENNETILRYSPTPTYINISLGSFDDNKTNAPIPTPDEAERIYALIDKAIQSGKLKGEKGDKGDKGEQGPRGEDGKDYTISVEIPTKTSDLENDNDFITLNQASTLIENAIGITLGGSY